MWKCIHILNGWTDKPHDGYVVYHSSHTPESSRYGYFPSGRELAQKFTKLCNQYGEDRARRIMGYDR
jgi:hypothetical protein